MLVRRFGFWLALVIAAPVAAQQSPAPPDSEQAPVYQEQVVVTASKSEQELVNAPASVSVVTSETIRNSPATNVGELLRSVPGVNVTQLSARDVNLTSRGATSALATSQLALVDGRTVYLDFFGMVLWDLVPTNPNDIRQIEVIRGPASAVWGANAMTGVVNIITKTPRELANEGKTSAVIGFGAFDRNVTGRRQGAGSFVSVNVSHAETVNARWSYKVSGGYVTQDPLPRPTGLLPSGTPYPSFQNSGTSQPKLDTRVDYDMSDGGRVTLSGGVAGTDGIIYSGVGPFDIDNSTRLSYITTRYQKGNRRVGFFTNILDGDALNLLVVGPNRIPLDLRFDTKTFDFDASDARTIARRHLVSYGGNYRHNTFDISLAPAGKDRNEGGGYVQDEIFFNDHFRWVVGGRLDTFSSIDSVVFSPRTTFMIKPRANQTFRLSFNRAFRAPSFMNDNLDVTILTPIVLPVVGAFAFPTRATGNRDLKQETLAAFEIGYTGVVGKRAIVTAAVYWNTTKGVISFNPVAAYSASNPPPGWPLPPQFVPPGQLTSAYTYLNFGTVKDEGFEIGVESAITRSVNVVANYSYQRKPVAEKFQAPFTINDINRPPKSRFNAGFDFSHARFLGNMSVNFTDSAYWQDVLDARYAGTTEAFTLVNAAFGVRWSAGKVVTSIKATNLANQEVMQHIVGDVLKRQVVGELRFTF